MGATFVVTLREAFEAALLLGIVYAYLERVGARTEYRWVTLGGVLGLVASVAAGVAVSFLSGPLLDLGPDLVAAAVIFVAGALVTQRRRGVRQHTRALQGHVDPRPGQGPGPPPPWVLGLGALTRRVRRRGVAGAVPWG